jgi:transcriptional regulator with XRE-family HTH domain
MADRKIDPARLKAAMEAQGIGSQAELARRIGVAPSQITHWKKGDHAPRGPEVIRLARVLDVTPEWLMGEERDRDELARVARTLTREQRDRFAQMARVMFPEAMDEEADGDSQH